MLLVLALRDSGFCNQAFRQMIDDIKESFSQFDSVVVSHVCREGNRAAHIMAKCAISQLLDNIWVEECPSFIQHVVAADCNPYD